MHEQQWLRRLSLTPQVSNHRLGVLVDLSTTATSILHIVSLKMNFDGSRTVEHQGSHILLRANPDKGVAEVFSSQLFFSGLEFQSRHCVYAVLLLNSLDKAMVKLCFHVFFTEEPHFGIVWWIVSLSSHWKQGSRTGCLITKIRGQLMAYPGLFNKISVVFVNPLFFNLVGWSDLCTTVIWLRKIFSNFLKSFFNSTIVLFGNSNLIHPYRRVIVAKLSSIVQFGLVAVCLFIRKRSLFLISAHSFLLKSGNTATFLKQPITSSV